MKFHFRLTPVDQIAPWTAPSQNDAQRLSWFGLSDGCYWVEVDGHALLRYSDALCEHWRGTYPEANLTSYINYQVVRLWEDMLDMLPAILDPVPDDLARRVAPDGLWGTRRRWEDWSEQALDTLEARGGDAWELHYEAAGWWGLRSLDSGYLRSGFGLWFWRVGDSIHVRWDNEDVLLDGIPAWQEATGNAALTVAEFVDAVRAFDTRFIAAMGERVAQVQKHWSRPEVFIDLDILAKEQRERATWLASALSRTERDYEWDQVRAALQEIEAGPAT